MQLDRRGPVVDLALRDVSAVPGEVGSRAKILDRLRVGDAVFRNLTRLAALAVLVILGGVVVSLAVVLVAAAVPRVPCGGPPPAPRAAGGGPGGRGRPRRPAPRRPHGR